MYPILLTDKPVGWAAQAALTAAARVFFFGNAQTGALQTRAYADTTETHRHRNNEDNDKRQRLTDLF